MYYFTGGVYCNKNIPNMLQVNPSNNSWQVPEPGVLVLPSNVFGLPGSDEKINLVYNGISCIFVFTKKH